MNKEIIVKEQDILENHRDIIPISKLDIYTRVWKIYIRIVEIGKEYTFREKQGRIMSVYVIDSESTELKITVFDSLIDLIKEEIKVGKTYIIKNGKIREKRNMDNKDLCKIEIAITNKTQIIPIDNNQSDINKVEIIPIRNNKIIQISSLLEVSNSSRITVVGCILTVGPLIENDKGFRREIDIADLSLHAINVTLFGNQAKDNRLAEGIIILIRNALLRKRQIISTLNRIIKEEQKDQDCFIYTMYNTEIEINPSIAISKDPIKLWTSGEYKRVKHLSKYQVLPKDANFQTLSWLKLSKGRTSFLKMNNVRLDYDIIKSPTYNACSICRHNIKEEEKGCKNCGTEEVETVPRYKLSIKVYDQNDNSIECIVFDEVSEKLTKISAKDIKRLYNDSYKEYKSIITRNIINKRFEVCILSKEWNLRMCHRIFTIREERGTDENIALKEIEKKEDKKIKIHEFNGPEFLIDEEGKEIIQKNIKEEKKQEIKIKRENKIYNWKKKIENYEKWNIETEKKEKKEDNPNKRKRIIREESEEKEEKQEPEKKKNNNKKKKLLKIQKIENKIIYL